MFFAAALSGNWPANQQEYRHGIEYIATGSCKEGFEHLDAHGFIHEDQADYLERVKIIYSIEGVTITVHKENA